MRRVNYIYPPPKIRARPKSWANTYALHTNHVAFGSSPACCTCPSLSACMYMSLRTYAFCPCVSYPFAVLASSPLCRACLTPPCPYATLLPCLLLLPCAPPMHTFFCYAHPSLLCMSHVRAPSHPYVLLPVFASSVQVPQSCRSIHYFGIWAFNYGEVADC
jgi:hypothetical protein